MRVRLIREGSAIVIVAMSCVTLVKAALARALFGAHTMVTVWRVVTQEDTDAYWKLAVGILVLALEGFHALCYRKGQELSWFCPSVFIYLCRLVGSCGWIFFFLLARASRSTRRHVLVLLTLS